MTVDRTQEPEMDKTPNMFVKYEPILNRVRFDGSRRSARSVHRHVPILIRAMILAVYPDRSSRFKLRSQLPFGG